MCGEYRMGECTECWLIINYENIDSYPDGCGACGRSQKELIDLIEKENDE